MKDGVVRWNAVQNLNESKNKNKNQIISIKATKSDYNIVYTHVADCAIPQHVAHEKQRTLLISACANAKIDTFDRANDCDKNENIHKNSSSFLVHKRNKPKLYEILDNISFSRRFLINSKRHNQQQQQPTRTLFGINNLYKILLICLQFSAVVFLCNLNVGFALAAKLDESSVELGFNEVFDGSSNSVSNSGSAKHFTHTWAVHIPNADDETADQVARDHGFVNMGKIFADYYHFTHHKVSKRSLAFASEHQTRLDTDNRVHWAQQQVAKSRSKRDFIRMRPSRTSSRALSLVDSVPFSDPKWSQMWYLNRGGGLDMNVIPAWKEGITGKGIVVTILDDGLESDHPDIEHNYDPMASYDVNSHDNDPMPHYDMTDSNRHGTRCAGEVAATANNSICAVGIAYGASVGGVRMLDGDVTDAVEARSLSLNPQHIDIYSASWGPDDDGKTVDGPGELASRAFIEGVTKGRGGKGSIFIWASGNGGRELDNCNCDGYTNSIWTLSISSATEEGHVPWYSEKCSSTLATTYSSGGQGEKQVVTTDLHHSCTVSHTGTSASAPLAAGIAALVLESNNNLTWRDLQHIVVRTAKPANLKDPTWSTNGVGRRVSHSFGYGLMDAAAMVKLARTWKTIPDQQRCEINAPHVDKPIPPMSYISLQLTVNCSSVNYLEHVQAKITLTSQRRGDITLFLISPAGTRVTLLTSRIHDVSRSGFNQWPFMSVHTWGESPHGKWQLEIHNDGRYLAQITQWDLIIYGTEKPAQPNDPAPVSPVQFSPFGGDDISRNEIDEPNDFYQNGKWRQQVGETSQQKKNACVQKDLDGKCLECDRLSFLYNGNCYTSCPSNTYPEKVLRSDDDNFGIMLRCGFCDAYCLRCYGPLNSQCTACHPERQLHKVPHTNETYCIIFAERSSGNNADYNDPSMDATILHPNGTTSYISQLFLLIAVPIAFATLVVIYKIYKRRSALNDNSMTVNYVYDRLALLSEAEEANIENNEIKMVDATTQEPIDRIESDEENSVVAMKSKSHRLQNPPTEQIGDSSESEEDLFHIDRNRLL